MDRMAQSLEEQLQETQDAISRIKRYGQTRVQNGKTVVEPDLAKLLQLESDLQNQIASSAAGSRSAVNYASRGRTL